LDFCLLPWLDNHGLFLSKIGFWHFLTMGHLLMEFQCLHCFPVDFYGLPSGAHSNSYEIIWTNLFDFIHLISVSSILLHLMSLGCNSLPVVSIDSLGLIRFMRTQSKSFENIKSHWEPPEFMRAHLNPLALPEFTWPQWFTHLPSERGKPPSAKGKRGKREFNFLPHFHLAFHHAHARHETKRFPGWAHSSSI